MEDKSGFGIGALVSFVLMAILGIIFIPILLDMAQNNVVTSVVTVPVTSIVYEEPINYNGYLPLQFENEVIESGFVYQLNPDIYSYYFTSYDFDLSLEDYIEVYHQLFCPSGFLISIEYYDDSNELYLYYTYVTSFLFHFGYNINASVFYVVYDIRTVDGERLYLEYTELTGLSMYEIIIQIFGYSNYPTPEPQSNYTPFIQETLPPFYQQSCGNQCGVALYEEIVVFKKED